MSIPLAPPTRRPDGSCPPDNRTIFDAPWTTEGAIAALKKVGGTVERRNFLITMAGGIGTVLAGYASATPAAAQPAGRRVGTEVAGYFEQRLETLRHLDDLVGSGQVHGAAVEELKMATNVLKSASYTEAVGHRLYSAAADAARAAGWTAYDSGHHAVAEKYFATAMRAAAQADDPVVGANTAAFWAIQYYSTGDPASAVALVEAAQGQAKRVGSARLTAMLHARACRAHSRAGDARATAREANLALDVYSNAGPLEDDLACVYWFNLGECYQLLGSAALNLGDPRRALRHFAAASTAASQEAYNGEAFPRGAAIYLAREAEARLAPGDVDAAVETAHQAVRHMGGVTSSRGTSTLADLRSKLTVHSSAPAVRNFLDLTV